MGLSSRPARQLSEQVPPRRSRSSMALFDPKRPLCWLDLAIKTLSIAMTRRIMSELGHLQLSCAVPTDGSLPPDSFRARRKPVAAESGQQQTL